MNETQETVEKFQKINESIDEEIQAAEVIEEDLPDMTQEDWDQETKIKEDETND